MPPLFKTHPIASFSSALVALLLALGGAYISLDRRVEARTTPDEVRQIVNDTTADKLGELTRSVNRVDAQINKVLDKLDTLQK